MQPFKPGEREEILETANAAPADLDEYERLLADSFTSVDPQALAAPSAKAGQRHVRTREARIRELHDRLFGKGSVPPLHK